MFSINLRKVTCNYLDNILNSYKHVKLKSRLLYFNANQCPSRAMSHKPCKLNIHRRLLILNCSQTKEIFMFTRNSLVISCCSNNRRYLSFSSYLSSSESQSNSGTIADAGDLQVINLSSNNASIQSITSKSHSAPQELDTAAEQLHLLVSNTAPTGELPYLSNLADSSLTAAVSSSTDGAIIELYGWLAAYINVFQSVAASAPVLQIMSLLRSIHDVSGLPWWLTIVVTTIVLRTAVTLPLAVYQQYIMARVELLRNEMMDVMKHLSMQTRLAKDQYGWDEKTARLFFKKQSHDAWTALVERDNCHPAKGVVLLLGQLPLWIMVSVALRNLSLGTPLQDDVAVQAYMELTEQGVAWCSDLTLSDPLLLLPCAMALVNLLITEVHAMQRPKNSSVGMRRMTHVFRGVALITFPIAVYMPSGVVLYWVTSSCCALAQTLLLLHPSVRQVLHIPLTPSTQQKPYARMVEQLQESLSGWKAGEKQEVEGDDDRKKGSGGKQ